MTPNQVLRLGISGTVVFCILENKPKNYEETATYTDEKGREIRRTRRNETTTIAGPSNPGILMKYISADDVVNTVQNEKENRRTLIRGLFETRDLDPKKGKWMLNCPISITQEDFVVSSEEWQRFENGPGKRLSAHIPLQRPEKVTIPWLVKNVPISTWIIGISVLVSVFAVGVYVNESGIYRQIKNEVMSWNEEATLNN